MLSEFQKQKVTKIFKFYDVNKNGLIESVDIDAICNTFSKEYNWDKETTEAFTAVYHQTWKNLVEAADKNNDKMVSHKELQDAYEVSIADKEAYNKYILPFFKGVFPIISEGKGHMTKEDYEKFYRSFRNPVEEADRVFALMDINKDGVISEEELSSMFYEFHMNQDEEHPSKHFFGVFEKELVS